MKSGGNVSPKSWARTMPAVHFVLVRDVLTRRGEVSERAAEAVLRCDTGCTRGLQDPCTER